MLTFSVGEPRTLHILSVGIDSYNRKENKHSKDPNFWNLNTKNDIYDLSALLEQKGQQTFDRVNMKVLFDKEATKEAIISAFREIVAQAEPQDTFVFHFSGHSFEVPNVNGESNLVYT
jgi:hypothetical protein